MIKSMTGFGIAAADLPSGKYTVEIKSLNSKFLELSLKLPKALGDRETQLRGIITKAAERGKVNFAINYEPVAGVAMPAAINKELLKAYYNELKALDTELGAGTTNMMITALHMPEVITYEQSGATEDEWAAIEAVVENAIAGFNAFREAEGKALKADLELRINNIIAAQDNIGEFEAERVPAIKQRMQSHLAETMDSASIDRNRFEQELIFYIEKLDITEEKTRLATHCRYFLETLGSEAANGKKLNFISQEIGREINTIGSKANHAGLQRLVVEMKEELEKVKEQLLNIL